MNDFSFPTSDADGEDASDIADLVASLPLLLAFDSLEEMELVDVDATTQRYLLARTPNLQIFRIPTSQSHFGSRAPPTLALPAPLAHLRSITLRGTEVEILSLATSTLCDVSLTIGWRGSITIDAITSLLARAPELHSSTVVDPSQDRTTAPFPLLSALSACTSLQHLTLPYFSTQLLAPSPTRFAQRQLLQPGPFLSTPTQHRPDRRHDQIPLHTEGERHPPRLGKNHDRRQP